MAVVNDHWAYFGDGNAAQIIDSRDYIEHSTGKKKVKFIFLPSKRITQMYEIVEEIDRATGYVVREFDYTEVVFLERGVYRTRCWVYPDFNGGPTPASRRFADLTTALTDTERLVRSEQAAKNRLFQELQMEREQKRQSLRLQADMVREVAKARGRVDNESDMMMPPEGQVM